jgi:formylmethanofuran dehydrogenase subunit E
VDGIIAATHCRVGGRALRILDFGKIAATFTDVHADASLRVAPAPDSRSFALTYTPAAPNRWQSMLDAYKIIPANELFTVQQVKLETPIDEIISRPNKKTACGMCSEEIFNGRETSRDGMILCKSCAGEGYYATASYKIPFNIPATA